MSTKAAFGAVAVAALAAGAVLWLATRPAPRIDRPAIAPVALYATTFADERGAPQALGRFQGKLLVLNFWATWCGPCREEIPAFNRVHARWSSRGVQFLGVSDEARETVERFVREVPVAYPLWVGDAAGDLGRRLGNRLGVLPFTVLVSPSGEVLDAKVGAYSEREIEEKLARFSGN